MARKKISQREAMRFRRRVRTLEQFLANLAESRYWSLPAPMEHGTVTLTNIQRGQVAGYRCGRPSVTFVGESGSVHPHRTLYSVEVPK